MITTKKDRQRINRLLDEWSEWVLKENRFALKSLGIRSWLGELVKSSVSEKQTYYTPTPYLDTEGHQQKMQQIDTVIRSLPSLQRQTVAVEYLVKPKDRRHVRDRWLDYYGRSISAHRKMVWSVKDLLITLYDKSLDEK